MAKRPIEECDLGNITPMPGVTSALRKVFAEAAAVCLEHSGHIPGVALAVDGQFASEFRVIWKKVTDQQRRSHNDLQDATELGAYGLAIFFIRHHTGQVVVQKSRKGTGFDFWLGNDDGLLFQAKSRLEVSGILAGGDKEISSRIARKVKQMARSDGYLPGYVTVIEFSKPTARIILK